MAGALAPLLHRLFPAGPPLRFSFYDGSALGPAAESCPATVVVASPNALRRFVWAPGELGLARAYVAGELDVRGDLLQALGVLHEALPGGLPPEQAARLVPEVLRMVGRLGLLGPPPAPPRAEIRLSGWRSGILHSPGRDRAAVTHHYDVGNDFYRVVLGPAMTYSCARFEADDTSLEEAQASKHELICQKLGLDEPDGSHPKRLLDVGCGWGSMALHAASRHGCEVVGVTLSTEQAKAARERVDAAGLGHLVDIRVQDYRELTDQGETFDGVSSIGMFEHVGESRMAEYFQTLYRLLRPLGRLLNHAISKPGGSRMKGARFVNRYVFPDGELIDVAKVVAAMEQAGFEVRDVESLREHYAKTLRQWVANLRSRYEEAVRLAGAERARVWLLYMSGSILNFEAGRIAIHQVLGVKDGSGGLSGMPPTRTAWR